jgi:hypothetical protein
MVVNLYLYLDLMEYEINNNNNNNNNKTRCAVECKVIPVVVGTPDVKQTGIILHTVTHSLSV